MNDRPLTRAEEKLLLRNDLLAFIEESFRILNPNTPFDLNWHLELIVDHLDRCRRGEIRKLIINVPPRSLKSHCISIALTAYLLGHNPSEQIVSVTYSQDLSNSLSLATRKLMESPFYRALFPDTQLVRETLSELLTSAGGLRLATSTGGTLTGRGGNWLIVDDYLKPDDALSDSVRESANEWFRGTLVSRQNDKRTGVIIVVMQRLHLDDLSGYLIEQGGWTVLKLPAIASETQTHSYSTPYGNKTFVWEEGEALNPTREPLPILEEVRLSKGSYHFDAQYLQEPVPRGGGVVKAAWIVRYAPEVLPEQFDAVVVSWDTANSTKKLAAYSACTVWGVAGKKVYLLFVYRARLDYPTLKRKVKELALAYSATVVLIEEQASGTQVVQELRSELSVRVVGVKPVRDKVSRIMAQTAMIENGTVRFPQEAPWLRDYLSELTSFPRGKYFDQVDSTSQALEWIASSFGSKAIIEFYRREVEEMRKKNGLPPHE